MNNDLEQFSEERLKRLIDFSDSPVLVSLSRIVLAAYSPAIPDDWINCSERMPEKSDKNYQVVALCVKKYDEGNYIGEPKKTIVQDWVIRLHPLNFTHWMPLPPPPVVAPKPESE